MTHKVMSINNTSGPSFQGPNHPSGQPAAGDLKAPDVGLNENCLSDSAPQMRPGVSNRTLRENGVQFVKIKGYPRLRIPYFKPREGLHGRERVMDRGSEFYRERNLGALFGTPKYFQPAGTSPHAYFPNGVFDKLGAGGRGPIVTEGEMKALALWEAGYAAIAIPGINSFSVDGQLVREIEFLMDQHTMAEFYFLGDADTSLNPAFSYAAVHFAKLIRQKQQRIRFLLPRVPLSDIIDAKGIDDKRQVLGQEAFSEFLISVLHQSIEVTHETKPEQLCLDLLERDIDDLCQMVPQLDRKGKAEIIKKLTRIATFCGPAMSAEVAEWAVKARLVNKVSLFNQEQKRQARKDAKGCDQPAKKTEPDMFYYPKGSKSYLYRTHDGSYTAVDRKAATNHLMTCGFMHEKGINQALPETDGFLTILEGRPVEWVGSLAGKTAGLHIINQRRVLVTKSPRLVTPAQGEWPTLRAFFSGLLDYDPATDPQSAKQAESATNQSPVFLSWLSLALQDLYNGGKFRPAQALVLAGPKRVGKNVCQDIITECLGGRQESPFSFMEGSSTFNGNLVGAEHWMVADEQVGTRYDDKNKLLSFIKKFCVNKNLHFNGKFVEAISLDPYRRLTISLNDDVDALKVLPSLTSNGSDKLMILRAFRCSFHGERTAFATFDDWWEAVKRELPSMIYDLINQFQIPEELQDRHYRVISYHNPELVELLQSNRPENEFAEIVLRHLEPCYGPPKVAPWRGSARKLIADLSAIGCKEVESDGYYSKPYHVGHYLTALAQSRPEVFRRVGIIDGITNYEVGSLRPDSPPQHEDIPPPPPPLPPVENPPPSPLPR